MRRADVDGATFGAEPAKDVDVLRGEVLEAGIDVAVLDEAGDTALPASPNVDSHVRLCVKAAARATGAR